MLSPAPPLLPVSVSIPISVVIMLTPPPQIPPLLLKIPPYAFYGGEDLWGVDAVFACSPGGCAGADGVAHNFSQRSIVGRTGGGGDDGNAEVTQGAFWRRDVCAGDDCFRGTNGKVAGRDCLLDKGLAEMRNLLLQLP